MLCSHQGELVGVFRQQSEVPSVLGELPREPLLGFNHQELGDIEHTVGGDQEGHQHRDLDGRMQERDIGAIVSPK